MTTNVPLIGIAAGLIKTRDHIPIQLLDTVSHITMGSYTLEPREGNQEPTTYIYPGGLAMINAINLKNQGLQAFLDNDLLPVSDMLDGKLASLRVSLAPTRKGELKHMTTLLNERDVYHLIDELEINGACPNHQSEAGIEPVLAYDMDAVERLLDEAGDYRGIKALKIAPDTPLMKLLKLIELCEAYDVDRIVSANTLKHPSTIDGKQVLSAESGGLSGQPLLAHTVVQVGLLTHLIEEAGSSIQVLAGGGILNGEEAYNLLTENGAAELQVATLYFIQGSKGVQRLVEETAGLMS